MQILLSFSLTVSDSVSALSLSGLVAIIKSQEEDLSLAFNCIGRFLSKNNEEFKVGLVVIVKTCQLLILDIPKLCKKKF